MFGADSDDCGGFDEFVLASDVTDVLICDVVGAAKVGVGLGHISESFFRTSVQNAAGNGVR